MSILFVATASLSAAIEPPDIATRAHPGIDNDGFVSHIGVVTGVRFMTDQDWNGVDTQFAIGFYGDIRQYDIVSGDWWVAPEISIIGSFAEGKADDGFTWDMRMGELSLGVHRPFVLSPTREIDLGAGILGLMVAVDNNQGGYEDEDTAVGAYVRGALRWVLVEGMVLSLEARASTTTNVQFNFSEEANAGSIMTLFGLTARF